MPIAPRHRIGRMLATVTITIHTLEAVIVAIVVLAYLLVFIARRV